MSESVSGRFRVRRGEFELDVDLAVEPGEVVALVGPNGSGKSTLLQVIAGLVPPNAGEVRVGDRLLTRRRDDAPGGEKTVDKDTDTKTDTTTGSKADTRADIQIGVAHRGVGLLGQDPLLFPHLSAAENIAFAARSRGVGRREARAEAQALLVAMGLADRGASRPAELSGGQQQRVALARALAARPAVLLLDEPMAALDVQTASQMRQLLREQVRVHATTTVLVTHDVIDAFVIADRIVVLNEGRVVASGTPTQVLSAPRNRFTAALTGVNFVPGTLTGGALIVDGGNVIRTAGTTGTTASSAGTGAAVFAPASVRVSGVGAGEAAPPTGPNGWQAQVRGLEPTAAGILIRADTAVGVVVAEVGYAQAAQLAPEPGSTLWFQVPSDQIRIHTTEPAPRG